MATTRTRKPALEDSEKKRQRAHHILTLLKKEFPHPLTALHHENAFQLLIATILSAQCTDERVNMVTPGLFKKYKTPQAFAAANPAELEQDIRPTGFYRMKTKNIIGCSNAIMERYKGEVPETLEELVTLPGVGRKTANVVLGQVFGIASGVVVDTHVHRLSRRLAFTHQDTPEKIEEDLMELFPKKQWIDLGTVLILHGRKTCIARAPRCESCPVSQLCPSAELY
ncbi:MAG: endonuclease III [Bacteroidetes bacterium]|nr:endonuclease III [Bacteroidota bacterium]MCW5896156.1 endonuclease III [Bacteroidota bacterium]